MFYVAYFFVQCGMPNTFTRTSWAHTLIVGSGQEMAKIATCKCHNVQVSPFELIGMCAEITSRQERRKDEKWGQEGLL